MSNSKENPNTEEKKPPGIRVAPKSRAEERKTIIKPGNFLERPEIVKLTKTNQVVEGAKLRKDRARFPTGIFPVDYMTGGGLPQFSMTHIYGPDESGKTSFVGNCLESLEHFCFRCSRPVPICVCKKEPRRMKGLVVAAETDLDGFWLSKIGAKEQNFYVAYPQWLEQAFTFLESGIMADDIGLIILDSLPGLGSIQVQNKDLEKRDYASESQIVKKFVQKVNALMATLMTDNKKPIFFLVTNQVRANMDAGQFGSKESFYGAWSFRHQDGIRLRIGQLSLNDSEKNKYGAEDLDTSIQHKDDKKRMQHVVKHQVQIKKHHFPVLNKNSFFMRAGFDIPERNLRMGEIDDYASVVVKGGEFGIFPKVNKELAESLKKDRAVYLARQYEIIKKAKKERFAL